MQFEDAAAARETGVGSIVKEVGVATYMPDSSAQSTRDLGPAQGDFVSDTPPDLPVGGVAFDSTVPIELDGNISDMLLPSLDAAGERIPAGSDAQTDRSIDMARNAGGTGEPPSAVSLDAGPEVRDAAPDSGNGAVVDARVLPDAHICSANAAACGGDTVNLAISATHCGGCNQACPPTSVCSFGICESGTSNWPTLQHDVQHTGENATELGQPPLCFAWSRQLDSSYGLSPPVVEDGRLFTASFGTFLRNAPLYALDVSDGSDLWNYAFADADTIGFPSVFSGSVYLANGQPLETSGSAELWSFGAATGSTQWVSPLAAQWEQYWAPIVVNGIVYTNAGTYGGLYGMAVSDGSQIFFQSLDQWDQWSPAFFNGKLYTFINGNFRQHDPNTGAVLWDVQVPFTWNGYSMKTAPVFGPNYAYVISPPSLLAIDTTGEAIAWTATGTFTGTPAVSGSAVYGISNGTLQARDSGSGTLLWTFVGDLALSYPPVIANGYIYVASSANVYAVSIATHNQVWTAAVGGWLAVAAHRLLVAGDTGLLSAYALSLSAAPGPMTH